MATNLQVNANTQQAVGAFNQLAQAIAGARGQFQNLNVVLANGATAARTYGNAVTQNITAGFSQLQAVAQGLFTALKFVGAGIELVFNSLIRELDKLQGFNAIMSVTTKTSADVANSFEFVRKTADKLGVQFDAISGNYAKLTAAIPEGANRLDIAQRAFLGVAMAARTMHATNQDTGLMFYAITQIASKGIVSMEELRRQLGEKLPGVIQIAAKALNTVPEELEKAIRKGIVISEKFLPIFGDALIRTFAESSEKAAQSVSAAMNRLTNVWVDFVKEVLDSGSGQSIVNVFDALREKLSDPYLISRFADFIKILADRFTDLIKNLTAEDIRNGFDTFSKAVEFLITLMEKLVSIFTWIINNAPTAGAILGGLAGVAAGAAFGPVGAAVGLAAGAAGGAYAGSTLAPSRADELARMSANSAAQNKAEELRLEQAKVRDQMLMPLLQQFKGLNSLKGLENLFKPENLTQASVSQLVGLLTDPRFKTDADKAQAVKDFAKMGIVLSPATAKLSDVLGGANKKDKVDPAERRIDATLSRAQGFDANFKSEKANLDTLFKRGKLDVEAYDKAYSQLLAKQPFMEQAAKAAKEAEEAKNKAMESGMQLLLRQLDVRDDLRIKLEDELRLAGLREDDLQVEMRVIDDINRFRDVGLSFNETELSQLREKYRIIRDTRDLTQAQSQILSQTVDKYKTLILNQQAMNKLMADPTSGFTSQDATDLTVNQDSNMSGTRQWIDAQKRQLSEYYAWIDGLRNTDRINEETALTAKSTAFSATYQKIRDSFVLAAQARLEAGNMSWIDGAVASLGRLANGFTTFTAGASNAMGSFFQSFTDGFANSIGRAIVYSDNLGDALNNVAREAIAGLISALVKLGIQWLVNAALGQAIGASAMAASLALSVAGGAATAAAWAPAAAMVSLATFGANAAPASAGIISTVGLSQALSLMGGFSQGGYTGDGRLDEIMGVVHGREYVVNAQATAAYRPILEAMNNGDDVTVGTPVAANPTYKTGSLIVNIENYGTSKDFEVQQLSEGEIRIIARDEAKSVVRDEAPTIVAGDIASANSRVSKALTNHTTASRRR